MKIRSRILIAILSGLACQVSHGEDSLCTASERIVFSCHIGEKTVSLCRPSNNAQTLSYRFGKTGSVELTFPDHTDTNGFHAATAPLYGGGMTIVAFSRGGFEYQLYSKVGREENNDPTAQREPIFEDGVIISKAGKQLKQLICDDGGEGFREDIKWIPSMR